jgi:hypothetical protein
MKAVEAAGTSATSPESNRNANTSSCRPRDASDGFNSGGGFCAWHGFNGNSWVNAPSPYGDVAFTNLPYIPDMGSSCGANFVNPGFAGLLDGVTMVEGHEFSETITDQNPFGGWWDSSGQENADKCAWISQGSARSQNVAFATGVFAMQSTWSNDGEACLIAHPVWGVPGLANSFVIDATPSAAYLVPGDSILSTLQSTTPTGDPQPITLTTTGGPPMRPSRCLPHHPVRRIRDVDGRDLAPRRRSATIRSRSRPAVPKIGRRRSASRSVRRRRCYKGVPSLVSRSADRIRSSSSTSPNAWIGDVTIGGGIGDADPHSGRMRRRRTTPTAAVRLAERVRRFVPALYKPGPGRTRPRVHPRIPVSRSTRHARNRSDCSAKRRGTDLAGRKGSARFFWINPPDGSAPATI